MFKTLFPPAKVPIGGNALKVRRSGCPLLLPTGTKSVHKLSSSLAVSGPLHTAKMLKGDTV